MVQRKMEQNEGPGTAVLIEVPPALGSANNFIISVSYTYQCKYLIYSSAASQGSG